MSDYYDDPSHQNEEIDEPEWDEYRAYFEMPQRQVKLEGKDYIALFIASLETIFLPFIIMIIVFFAIGLILFLLV
ncbi:MAG: hypothetical protein ACFFBL_09580 [Promethearchaeota archaeon]